MDTELIKNSLIAYARKSYAHLETVPVITVLFTGTAFVVVFETGDVIFNLYHHYFSPNNK